MEASSGANKRKREDDCPTTSIIGLGDGLQEVLGCLEHPDRLSLATTCKTMVAAVEAYSQVVLQQLTKDHAVDEFFEGRTKERFAGKTGEPPARCLLRAAHSTYLCTLEMFPGDRGISGEVAFSKDGTRLVVAGTVQLNQRPPFEQPQPPLKIYVWDLPTKKLLRTLEVPTIDKEYEVHNVYFVESSITVCTNQRVLVVAATEEAEPHSCRHRYIESVTQKDSATIVFVDKNDKAYSFNIITGEKKSIASLPAADWWCFGGVLHDRWLIGSRNNTMVNLDLQNGLAIAASHRAFHVDVIVSFDDGSGTVHFYDYEKMEALVVNASTGKFQKVDQFPVDVEEPCECRGIFGPHFFFERNHYHHNAEEKKAFLVALTKTNCCVRSLQFPPNRRCDNVPYMVQSNGKEIFVSVEPRAPQTPSGHGVELAVYSANFRF